MASTTRLGSTRLCTCTTARASSSPSSSGWVAASAGGSSSVSASSRRRATVAPPSRPLPAASSHGARCVAGWGSGSAKIAIPLASGAAGVRRKSSARASQAARTAACGESTPIVRPDPRITAEWAMGGIAAASSPSNFSSAASSGPMRHASQPRAVTAGTTRPRAMSAKPAVRTACQAALPAPRPPAGSSRRASAWQGRRSCAGTVFVVKPDLTGSASSTVPAGGASWRRPLAAPGGASLRPPAASCTIANELARGGSPATSTISPVSPRVGAEDGGSSSGCSA